MRLTLHLLLLLFLLSCRGLEAASLYDLEAVDIEGRKVKLGEYSGTVLLVVNVASQCGYTDGHYRGLKRLHDILGHNKMFSVLGFPCNQFGGQEPGEADEIRDVAFNKYQVQFPLFEKTDVVGESAHPVWKFLADNSGTVPTWNFFKYLVDHHGNVVQVWPPQASVEDIFDAVQSAVMDAEGVGSQMESPLANHDEL